MLTYLGYSQFNHVEPYIEELMHMVETSKNPRKYLLEELDGQEFENYVYWC